MCMHGMFQVSGFKDLSHFQAHQLNLCVVNDCSIPNVRNANGIVYDIANFYF